MALLWRDHVRTRWQFAQTNSHLAISALIIAMDTLLCAKRDTSYFFVELST